jgi:hypothetical protein
MPFLGSRYGSRAVCQGSNKLKSGAANCLTSASSVSHLKSAISNSVRKNRNNARHSESSSIPIQARFRIGEDCILEQCPCRTLDEGPFRSRTVFAATSKSFKYASLVDDISSENSYCLETAISGRGRERKDFTPIQKAREVTILEKRLPRLKRRLVLEQCTMA